MKPIRPATHIHHDLDSALALRARYLNTSLTSPFALQMQDDNEREISQLELELSQALSGDLQLSLDGDPVADHRVSVPYFNKVTESLQSVVRAVYRSMKSDGVVGRAEAMLAIASTGPGSFRVNFVTSPLQLDLLDEPLVDQALASIVELLQSAEGTVAPEAITAWASRAAEPSVRAMIRLAAALAGSKGDTSIRWRGSSGRELTATVPAASAKVLAATLAGHAGREVVEVTGHLRLAQDEPPRAGIRTATDDYSATIPNDDLLDRVKDLLFEEVRATLMIDMRTSQSTGLPATFTELVDLEPADVQASA